LDFSVREENEIGSEHTGDRSAGSDGRKRGMQIKSGVGDAGQKSASQVKEKIAEASQTIFDIVSKDPKPPHVTDQMKPTAVKKD